MIQKKKKKRRRKKSNDRSLKDFDEIKKNSSIGHKEIIVLKIFEYVETPIVNKIYLRLKSGQIRQANNSESKKLYF
jgi:hypothetical protein